MRKKREESIPREKHKRKMKTQSRTEKRRKKSAEEK
jgi:hypothetical protein